MKHQTLFEGAASALITPMHADGSVDFAALEKMVDWQIEEGISSLVICGTSGEGATLSDEEHMETLRVAYAAANKRIPMIAGTGSNDTRYAIELSQKAVGAGYEGLLVVTPYYNKATQEGLYQMYTTIADNAGAPIIIYNVPSRTGCEVEPELYARLAEHPAIVGIKEANGNISKISQTMALTKGDLALYSGNDDQVVPLLSLGGKGVISVISNILPKETDQMVKKYLAGDVKGAMEMQWKYSALIKALFSEVNPIPVKAACAAMGLCENVVRMPLTPMTEAKRQVLLQEMRNVGIEV